MSTVKVLLGALAGIAAGALVGIIFAPEKGSNTRKQIKDKSNDYLDKLKSNYNEFSESLTGKIESAKKELGSLAEEGKSRYNEVKKDANI